jgi:hypothetical protein
MTAGIVGDGIGGGEVATNPPTTSGAMSFRAQRELKIGGSQILT